MTGQHYADVIEDAGVTHETIDNQDELVQRIVMLCRKAALSPYHYTPAEHHPDVVKTDSKDRPDRKPSRKAEPA